MRAAMILGKEKIGVTQIPDLEPDGKSVIIKTKLAGVTGYDTTLWELGDITTETVPGHEIVGTVVNPGPRDDLKEGDRVTVLPLAACMECELCKSGQENMCFKNRNTPGKSKTAHGTFSEFFAARPEFVKKIPDRFTDFEGLMLSPAATAYHMVKEMGVSPGWKVLISGGGIMGALVAMWCKYFGAKYIAVFEKNKTRALNLMDYGETTKILDPEDREIIDIILSDTRGLNAQFECSGNARFMNTGILTLRRNSTIATLAMYKKSAPINFFMLNTKLIRIRPFNAHTPADFDKVAELVSANPRKLNLKRYYSASVALNDLQSVFEELMTDTHKYEKVVINKF
ncbi:MAG: zinc-binding dehydrogenase [Clostridia bacterium]|nr:zinc-binding dehydrogenase [Clostridia bacterium]